MGTTFSVEIFFQKNCCFYSILHIEQQKSAFFQKKATGLSKLHISCPNENCPENFFVLNVLEPVSDIHQKIDALSWKFFRRCFQNFIALQSFIFSQKLYFFVSRLNFEQKHFGLLSKTFCRCFQKCILFLHWNYWKENCFFFNTISHWLNSFQHFAMTFQRGWKNCILPVHREFILSNKRFPKISSILFIVSDLEQ